MDAYYRSWILISLVYFRFGDFVTSNPSLHGVSTRILRILHLRYHLSPLLLYDVSIATLAQTRSFVLVVILAVNQVFVTLMGS